MAKFNQKKLIILSLIFVVVLIGAFLMGKPVAIGYSTYQAVKASNLTFDAYKKAITDSVNLIESLKDENINQRSIISDCENKTKILKVQLSGINEQITKMQEDNKKEIQDKLEQIALLNVDLKDKNADLKKMSDRFNSLAESSARRICCKMKVENPKISYYSVRDDTISCNENHGNVLHCPFGD